MKVNVHKKKRLHTETYVFAGLVIVSFSLLLFSTRSFVVNIRDTGLSAFTGIRGGIHSVTNFFSNTVLSIRELSNLRTEYSELQERLTRYVQLERSAAGISQENVRLREQLGFSNIITYAHIPAEISGRDHDNLFSAFVINKGKSSGVENGMPVIAFQNGMQALVGKVIQTAQLESLVLPLYDSRSYVSARFSRSRYEGIVEGHGNPSSPLLMRSITKRAKDELDVGDIVITSGLGGVYPPDIILGRVSKILSPEDETSLEAEIECAIDFSKLEYVFVINENKGDASNDQMDLTEDKTIEGTDIID
ncbi:MAG: rod shape-determining protein MreC [Spirochaetaceae bacterium]|jgi:rod shape-determining protein MreC|nr:rod shape-determining protein MreC [Spirochaetaceae bacterium]